MSKFSEHLRRIKERRCISLEELSEYLGDIASVSTISKWMSGMHLPDRKVLNVINEKLRLTKIEYEDLVESYNEVAAGEMEYNDYCLVRNLINKSGENKYLTMEVQNEEKDRISLGDKGIRLLESKTQVVNGIKKVICSSYDHPEEPLRVMLHGGFTFFHELLESCWNEKGFQAVDEIICFDTEGLSERKNSLSVLSIALNMILKNSNFNIYIDQNNYDDMDYLRNWIITPSQIIQYNDSFTVGIIIGVPEQIQKSINHFNKRKHGNTPIVTYADSAMEYVDIQIEIPTWVTTVEFQPCVALALDSPLMEAHFYPDIPNREELINAILNNFTLRPEGVAGKNIQKITVFCSLDGVYDFIESGIVTAFPFPIYEPLNKLECCMLLERLIELIKEERLELYFVNPDVIPDIKKVQIEIRDCKSHARILFKSFYEDMSSNHIAISNKRIMEQFDNFIQVLKMDGISIGGEDAIVAMEKIIREYSDKEGF